MNTLGFGLNIISVAGMISMLSWAIAVPAAQAIILEYGNRDCFGWHCYGETDPTTGAPLIGLRKYDLPVFMATQSFVHPPPVVVNPDHLATHQLFCTAIPDLNFVEDYCPYDWANLTSLSVVLDYSSALSPNGVIEGLTLGIAANGFGNWGFDDYFVAFVNGQHESFLSTILNSLDSGPTSVQFFSINIPVDLLTSDHQLTLEIIREGENENQEGFAVDFFTLGIESIPTPTAILPVLMGMGSAATRKKQQQS